jgi:hypothetical protein
MANKGVQRALGATDWSPRPGCFVLGSAQSRAAATAMLVARMASKEDELHFEAVSILDGSRLIDGLAETIRAARMRIRAGELSPSLPATDGETKSVGGMRPDCLSERIRKARERVRRAQGQATMP